MFYQTNEAIMEQKNHNRVHEGFVMVSMLMLMTFIMGLGGIYYITTSNDIASMRYSKAASSSFYTAEAGLNIRAQEIRDIFVGYNQPTGTTINTALTPCSGSNLGTGDFRCKNYLFNSRTTQTYVLNDAGNPYTITVPPGELYQNLQAQEYRYRAKAIAVNSNNETESNLELRFKSRLVPLFQFAVFYNKDLEILPGPAMTLSGPVHTNNDLYLYSNSATLTIQGQVTSASDIYRGRKDGSISPNCNNQTVNIFDPAAARSLIPSCPSRTKVTTSHASPFNGMIRFGVQPVTVPGPEVLAPTPGTLYWSRADLRLALVLNASNTPTGIEVRNADDTTNNAATAQLNSNTCAGIFASNTRSVQHTQIYNFREARNIRLLDVDLRGLLNCLHTTNWFGTGKTLADSTEGGLVFHFTAKGPNSNSANSGYGVRIRNGSTIASSIGGAPAVKGLTIISDQALYSQGDYNSTNKKPAAFMADTINVLSNNWSDTNASSGLGSRVASNTTINAAWLGATSVTGNIEGEGGQGGAYNGGVENYPRLHEDWSGRTLTYRGSIVSLNTPQHVTGTWAAQSYSPPSRDWNYDTSFNNAANLPPITPRFVYLKQELFVRDFDG